jgi:hypothetical protein
MEKLNPFEELLNYPIENGLVYETHLSEQRFHLSPNDPLLNIQYITFKKQGLIFCAYDSYSPHLYSTKTFSGIYSPIRLNPKMEFELSRKHWFNNIFIYNKRKTGIDLIDRNFTISAAKVWNIGDIFREKEVHLFLDLEKIIKPLKLIIQRDYIPIINELKGHQIIGLETNQWISREEEVDVFFNLGKELIESVITASALFY